MGRLSEASGHHSTAMGEWTKAIGYASTAMGQFNVLNTGDNKTVYAATNTAFSIGNGTAEAARSDAFSVLFNGDTYVSGDLDIQGKITGLRFLSSVTEGGITGLRISTADDKNYGDIGFNAVDLSYSTNESSTNGATGEYSTAMGNETTASGYYSTAMG